MNIIDYAILAFFALSVLMGVYSGSVHTGLNMLGVGLSLIIAKIAYPYMTDWIAGHEKWMEYLVYFSEGSSHIPTAMMEYARTEVTSLTAEQVAQVIESAGFSAPFDAFLAKNIQQQVYAPEYVTLFDYFDQTVADVSLNTISFVLTFAFTYLVCTLLIVLIDKTFTFPLLKAMDSVVGGVIGVARGFVGVMILATMVPLVVNMLQIDLITEMVAGSAMLEWFYPNNWFFGWIEAVV